MSRDRRGATLAGVSPELLVCHLEPVEYRAGVALQEGLRARVQSGELGDVLLLLEHPPVYTLGRRSKPEDVPMGEAWYRSQGIDVVRTDRGGKLTYHGPGQLVGYPIMRVEAVLPYVRALEATIVAALAGEGIEAGCRERLTGVWVQDRKIASIGVRLARGVSTHGFAINVDNDLQPFEWVVPCGLPGVRMTSVCAETGHGDRLPDFRLATAARFAEAFGREARVVTPAELGVAEPVAA